MLNEIMPYPKTKKTIQCRTRQMKSSIITDKSEKLKQFPHLNHSSISESDTDLHIESDNDDCFDESFSSDEESIYNIPPIVPNGFFVVTKGFSCKSYKNFIAQIISRPDEDNDYEVKFLKRSSKIKDGFVFPKKLILLQPPTRTLCVYFYPLHLLHKLQTFKYFQIF